MLVHQRVCLMSNEFFSIFNNFARHYIYSKYWNKHSHSFFSESAAYPDDQIRPMTTGWWKTYWLFSEQMPVKEKLTVGESCFYVFFFRKNIFPKSVALKNPLPHFESFRVQAGSWCLYIDDIHLGLEPCSKWALFRRCSVTKSWVSKSPHVWHDPPIKIMVTMTIPSGYVKIAIENDPVEIVDFPIEHGGSFHSFL